MNKLNNQQGQALVEFALVAVILLVLALGVGEFGRAWYYDNALDDAVRGGVRMASELYPVPATDDARIQTYVKAHVPSSIGGSVTVNVVPPTTANGKLVKVTAQYVFAEPILITLDSLAYTFFKDHILTNSSLTLQRTGTMYYELAIP